MIASASSAERDQRGKIAGRFFRSNEASKRDPETPGMRGSLSSAIFKGFRFDFISTLGRSGPTWRVVDVDEANFHTGYIVIVIPSSLLSFLRLKMLSDTVSFL